MIASDKFTLADNFRDGDWVRVDYPTNSLCLLEKNQENRSIADGVAFVNGAKGDVVVVGDFLKPRTVEYIEPITYPVGGPLPER